MSLYIIENPRAFFVTVNVDNYEKLHIFEFISAGGVNDKIKFPVKYVYADKTVNSVIGSISLKFDNSDTRTFKWNGEFVSNMDKDWFKSSITTSNKLIIRVESFDISADGEYDLIQYRAGLKKQLFQQGDTPVSATPTP